jgi:putative membrane protein
MVTEGSLNHSMDSALKHYSSMFFLPSFRKSLLSLAAICVLGVGLSTFFLFPSVQGLAGCLVLGVSLFLLTFVADFATTRLILKTDPIYLLRRSLALSLFCWLLWLLFIVVGVALAFTLNWLLWVDLCLFGYAAVVTLRATVFIATSSAATLRKVVSALLSPIFCILVFFAFWTINSSSVLTHVLPFLVLSPVISCVAAYLFLSILDRLGRKTYLVPSLQLFRAFMLNWVVGLNAPIEKLFEKMGEDTDVEVTLLKFDSSKPKAAVIVPLVHPGPFKNIGSSLLPSILKHEFEKEFGCETCVPLGILGHELDLASQTQNKKIVSKIIESAKFNASFDLASPFVKVSEDAASASCQVFGNTVFLSFTLAPKTTEDLPQELGRVVGEEAKKYGLKCAVVVNTHNSINDIVDTEEYLAQLQTAASKCLQKVVALPTSPFLVGAATIFPEEFSLKDGMGSGGITAVVVQVQKQKTVYVVIDGNNMVSGLREKVLAALASVGFDDSEVFTTDTHAVSAVVLGKRGYHPVGEAMDNDVLIRCICDVAKKAEATLEPSKAGCMRLVVPKVRVIGEARLQSMTLYVDKAIQKAKQMLIPVFGLEGLLLILLLALL